MRFLILARDPYLYSTLRLVEAGEALGHEVVVVDPLRCYIDINPDRPQIYLDDEALSDFDGVIPRFGGSITFYGSAVLRQFEVSGLFVLNDSVSIGRARDKLHSMQLLARAGVAMPLTGIAHSVEDTQALIERVGGAPLVVKLLGGTQGRGVVLAETAQAAESLIDAFRELEANFLVQEFISESKGSDIRCLVLADRVVAAMRRKAQEGEFRSNLHRGGSAEAVRLSAAERATAVAAARAIGLQLAGVDILQSARGPLVIEVNASPGLEGIERVTGKDLAGMIVELVARRATRWGKTVRRSY